MDLLETTLRWIGAAGFLLAVSLSGREASRALRAAPGRAAGWASRLRALPAYLILAVPYFALWAPLWRPLPIDPGDGFRAAFAIGGALLGATGLALYLGGRLTLGRNYNVSSSFGTELRSGHRLITTGPYRFVRHPMYVGLMLAACGALLVYRTWTTVWIFAAIPGAVLKARIEDRLLAEEFGHAFAAYRDRVPGWIPHSRQPDRPASRKIPRH